MKTIVVLAGLVLALVACSGGASSDADATAPDVPGQDAVDAVDAVGPDVPADRDTADVAVPDAPDVNDPGPDAALDADAVADADACVPDCTNRDCGSDGCRGSCGSCGALAGDCSDSGHCGDLPHCDWPIRKPTTWGPAAIVSAMQTPADSTVVQTTCFDYTGDGKGDSGLKGTAAQVNGPLADAIATGQLAILIELAGVTDFTSTTSFQVNGLMGTSTATAPATSGDFYVQESSYDTGLCIPAIYFTGASIIAGVLYAGPAQFQLTVPIETDLSIDVPILQAKLKGTIQPGATADGFALEGGVLSGVITKAALDTAYAKAQAYCDASPAASKPTWCVTVSSVPIAFTWFDLHQNGDGTFSAKTKDLPGDAMSVCMTFTAAPARIVGFPPTPQ